MAGVEGKQTTARNDVSNESAVPLAGNWQFPKTQSSCSGLVHTLDIKPPNQWTDSIRKRVEPEESLLVELNELRESGESIIFEKKTKGPKTMRRRPNKIRI